MLAALPHLVDEYQIIHQVGEDNIKEIEGRARVALADSLHKDNYKPFSYLNDLALRMTAGASQLVISRAGSTIFEIAAWGLPSILIPLPDSAEDHQVKNAFTYARTGACVVVDQNNLTPGLLVAEIKRILGKPEIVHTMQNAARSFARVDAAKAIANVLIDIALSHEA